MSDSTSLSQALHSPSPFRSFFLGGFESAYHVNCYGRRVDMIASTRHDIFASSDYQRAKKIGIHTVRDAIRWPLVDRGSRYDLSSFIPMLEASIREEVEVIWTLCHYGWPDDLDLFSSRFINRFVKYAKEMTKILVDHGIEAPFFIPFNEISYLCHAITVEGDMYPYAIGQGWELKRHIVRATIEATDAIRQIAPKARFVHVDPIIHVVPPRGRPEFSAEAAARKHGQYEAAEMIAGRVAQDLGGREDYLDLVGVNFYHANQWEHPGDKTIFWHHKPRDSRWKPLSELLKEAEQIYKRPLFIAETSHVGTGRPEWIKETLSEIHQARTQGIDVYGVCLYPIIDRHCWVDETHWHNSGIWDIDPENHHERVLAPEYYATFNEMRNKYFPDSILQRSTKKTVRILYEEASTSVSELEATREEESDAEVLHPSRTLSITDDM